MDSSLQTSDSIPNRNGIPLQAINSVSPNDTNNCSKTYSTSIRCDTAINYQGEDLGKAMRIALAFKMISFDLQNREILKTFQYLF